MLSSRFLALSSLYLFYAAGLVAAVPGNQFGGGNQFCESVRTVTVVQTVTNGQPPPSSTSQPANNANSPPPVVTQKPGNVNLGNGNNNGNNGTKGGNKKPGNGNKNGNGGNNQSTNNGNTSTSSVASPSSTPPVRVSTGTGDPSTSPTLDPSVIQNVNGKANGTGQIDSLVSSDNFINYCIGKTLTNGNQVKTGSCNPTPMGDIPSVDNMPSAKFNSPKNFDTLPSNTKFTIALQVNNLDTGLFTNAANTYFAAPQQLSGGIVHGHSHVTVQQMTSLDSTQPLDPKVFAFFKGLNTVADNGVLSVDVTSGLPAGFYRIASIVAAGNHQEAMGPVAQRGSFNDAVYITVTDNGQSSDSSVSSSSVSADPTSSTALPSGVSSDTPSSTVSSPPVSSTLPSEGGDGKGGNDSKDPPTSLPDSTITSTASVPTETGGNNGNGNRETTTPSQGSDPGGDSGFNPSNGGDPTSSTPTETTTPFQGSDPEGDNGFNPGNGGDPTSPTPPETATPFQGGDPGGDSGFNHKRMHRRSRLA